MIETPKHAQQFPNARYLMLTVIALKTQNMVKRFSDWRVDYFTFKA